MAGGEGERPARRKAGAGGAAGRAGRRAGGGWGRRMGAAPSTAPPLLLRPPPSSFQSTAFTFSERATTKGDKLQKKNFKSTSGRLYLYGILNRSGFLNCPFFFHKHVIILPFIVFLSTGLT